MADPKPNYRPTQPPPFGCRYLALVVACAFVFGLLGAYVGDGFSPDQVQTTTVVPDRQAPQRDNNALVEAVKKGSPSVVSISVTGQAETFLGPIEQKGGGTGFILTSDGLIGTNRHVVEANPRSLTVVASDGRTYPAEVKSLDPSVDFAIIKIDAKNLPVSDLGNSDGLPVGETVIAIGNALGEFQNTVTTGVISARERTIVAGDEGGDGIDQLENLLQTDAAINPGNSGGPLVNLAGQVIAVNVAVDPKAQGIGFAIPINQIKQAITSYQQKGKIIRPSLGVRFRTVTPEVAKLAKLPTEHGALLVGGRTGEAVLPGSAAAKAGLRAGDILTVVDGVAIDAEHTLAGIIAKRSPGDEIEITYLREGKEAKVRLKLDERQS